MRKNVLYCHWKIKIASCSIVANKLATIGTVEDEGPRILDPIFVPDKLQMVDSDTFFGDKTSGGVK